MEIRNAAGEIIQRCKNLRGIRRFVSKSPIKILAIDKLIAGGKLSILFESGSTFECNFASYNVLVNWVRKWRSVYGHTLLVQGVACGIVTKDNPSLR